MPAIQQQPPPPGVPGTLSPWPLPTNIPPFSLSLPLPTAFITVTPPGPVAAAKPLRQIPEPCRLHKAAPKWARRRAAEAPITLNKSGQQSQTSLNHHSTSDTVANPQQLHWTTTDNTKSVPPPRRIRSAMVPELPEAFPNPLLVGRLRNRRDRQRPKFLDLPAELRCKIFAYLFECVDIKLERSTDGVLIASWYSAANEPAEVCTTFRRDISQLIGIDPDLNIVRYFHWARDDYKSLAGLLQPSRRVLLAGVRKLYTRRVEVKERALTLENLRHLENLEEIQVLFEPESLPKDWWYQTPPGTLQMVERIYPMMGFDPLNRIFLGKRWAFFSQPQITSKLLVPFGIMSRSGPANEEIILCSQKVSSRQQSAFQSNGPS
jgi:hypothetical protein